MPQIHLLVLVHGMWGNSSNLAELARVIRLTYPPTEDGIQLRVLLAETNRDDATYDGIDYGGERVAQEVEDEVAKITAEGNTVTRFSVTGYSLGGLVARYLIGVLHQHSFFTHISPTNFTTLATPHIGLPRYPSLVSSIVARLGPRLLSRTGEQFYCVDGWGGSGDGKEGDGGGKGGDGREGGREGRGRGRGLIEVMADPDRIFYQALVQFEHIRIYANAINDITVPYVTAAIESQDPFAEAATNGIQITLDPKYAPLIKSYHIPPTPPTPTPKPPILSPKWFRSLGPSRPLLPPFLQLRFPFNLAIYTLLPLLLPLALTLALLRLHLSSRSSRARIESLKKDAGHERTLVHILAHLERAVEVEVGELIEGDAEGIEIDGEGGEGGDGGEGEDSVTPTADGLPPPNSPTSPTSKTPKSSKLKSILHKPTTPTPPPHQPILTAPQLRCIASLNAIPHLRKELAYFPNFRNAHAVIVCRDMKRFKAHGGGEGVVRHWADGFVL